MKIIKQALKFFSVSGIGWISDFIIYLLLTNTLKINLDLANMFSSLFGVTFVFFVSTRKIFINNSKINLRIKYIIYVSYQLLLIFFVSKLMLLLKDVISDFDIKLINNYISIVVKIFITPFTMIINYLVMKYLIEKL